MAECIKKIGSFFFSQFFYCNYKQINSNSSVARKKDRIGSSYTVQKKARKKYFLKSSDSRKTRKTKRLKPKITFKSFCSEKKIEGL